MTEDEAAELLAELNRWEEMYGIEHSTDPMVKSTGEANARIANLKRKLAELGVRYHWDGHRYVADTDVDPDEHQ